MGKIAPVLFKSLKNKTTLTTLNLWYKSIKEDEAQALGEALKTNSSLITLDLQSNSINDIGAQVLAEALKTNSTLTTLYLQNNSIGSNGGQDTIAPLSGYRARSETNGTRSFFVGYDLNKTEFETRADIDRFVMKTPVSFAGNQYLLQVPMPENVNITKIYVSEVALPSEKCDVDLFISNGLVRYFSKSATVLKITLPKVVSGQYVKYHFDAHVFLAPLKSQQEITRPETSKDDLYKVPLWGRKIRTTWGSEADCTYCKKPDHHRRACPELQKKICHNCKKSGHTALMFRKPVTDQGLRHIRAVWPGFLQLWQIFFWSSGHARRWWSGFLQYVQSASEPQ
ncbi:hypothetical protein BGZ92_004139, partial [Podila epicladia]